MIRYTCKNCKDSYTDDRLAPKGFCTANCYVRFLNYTLDTANQYYLKD